jgi:hypothetical protein
LLFFVHFLDKLLIFYFVNLANLFKTNQIAYLSLLKEIAAMTFAYAFGLNESQFFHLIHS